VAATRTIVFVTPPYHCGVVEVAGTWPPLTFVTLAAQAERAGWRAVIYDAMSLRDDHGKIAKHLSTLEFDVLATSAITPTFPDAADVCRTAKRVRPDCVTVMGGVHPTFMAGEALGRCAELDYVIAGEGEQALYEFLAGYDDPDTRHRAAGLVRRQGEGIVANPRAPLLENLDELPMAWHLLDWELYTYFVVPGSRLGAVSTSRGCDHGCTFCSQQKFWQQQWRARRPEAVVADMIQLRREYGVNVQLMTDEYPTRDADRWEEILDRIIAADLDLHILMETRVEDIARDEAILPKYRQAGIVHIYVGAEATDQATLDRINKEISIEDSVRAIRLIAEHDMISETSFVLGFPEETPGSIDRTLELAREFNPDFAHFLAITPWPYADLYEELRPHIVDFDYRNYNLIEPVIKPVAMSIRDIDRAIIDCYRRFYMPKMLAFQKMKSPFRRDYLLRSTKLIMQSSFLVKKFARLGVDPVAAMKDVLGR
jgi:anaerobic magnesium-protoporphyrin IX monomethyl ester cyclase